jgi:hypothetical protein
VARRRLDIDRRRDEEAAQEGARMPMPDLSSKAEPDQFLDGDMRPADIIEVLEGLSLPRRRYTLAAAVAWAAAPPALAHLG